MKQLYVYLVMFATLMMVIGGSVSIFMAAANLISPSGYYQTYAEYKSMLVNQPEGKGKTVAKDEAGMQKDYADLVNAQKERERRQAVHNLIASLGWIVVPLPVFLYFQRQRKKDGV